MNRKPLNLIVFGLFYCLTLFALMLVSAPLTTLSAETQKTLPRAYSYPISPDRTNSKHMQIQLLNSFVLKPSRVNSLPIHELSGLAWDDDEQLLYAVSDEGLLYHIKLSQLDEKINNLTVTYATRLKQYNGKPLKGKFSDSEGLTLVNANNGRKGDSHLIISFENKPRIDRYSPTGDFISTIKTPENLNKRKYYRHNNKALESVSNHPKYGFITAAENPQISQPITIQTLYSNKGKQWHFLASKEKNSSITGLEILSNGDALVLERAFSNPLVPINIKLRQVFLEDCDNKQMCKTKTLANFNGANGWILDNFEGLTHLKDKQYLIVSDNNKSPFQKTIFMHLKIL